MRLGGGLPIAIVSMLAPAALAQEEPTGRVECDVASGHYTTRTPGDLNALLFQQKQTLSGSWKLEEVYRHREFGSFLALVLWDDDDTFSEVTIHRCAVPGFNCFKVRTVDNKKVSNLPGAGFVPQISSSNFRLKRESSRQWLLELGSQAFQLSLDHDVKSFHLKCVGSKGWFSFDDPLLG